MILPGKFHVVSSLLSVLKRAILMLSLISPWHSHLKLVWLENEKTVNLKRASFVVIMLLNEGLTHLHSQKKPRLHFGKSFTLSSHWLSPAMPEAKPPLCCVSCNETDLSSLRLCYAKSGHVHWKLPIQGEASSATLWLGGVTYSNHRLLPVFKGNTALY